VQAIYSQTDTRDKETGTLQPICYLRPYGTAGRADRKRGTSTADAQLRYVVIYGAACSYCLGRAERLEGSYLRTFSLELKEELAETLAAFVTSILAGRLDAEEAAEPPLRQIIGVLQQVMCKHDAEKLAISVFEIYKDS